MKVTFRAGGVILPALALTLGLAACGSGNDTSYDPDLLVAKNVAVVDCKTVDKARLQATLNFVNTATGKSEDDILKLNEGATTLEPLKKDLQNKVDECGGGASAQAVKGNGAPAPWPCPENMKQAFDPNSNGNFASGGITDTNSILALAAKDARYLGFIGSQSLPDVASDPNPLLIPDNSCLSQRGQEVWNQLKGALTAKAVTVDNNGEAPANYYNTGMVNGRPVVDSQPGIGGDRAAVVYTFPNGSKLHVMKRCGNLALPAQGSLPKGETNHQRPPGTTVTPPPPPEGCTEPGGCRPIEVCPPEFPHGNPKTGCKDDAGRGTTNGNGLGTNTGTGDYTGPLDQPPPTSRVNPPANTTVPPPPPVTVTQDPNPPTVAPSTQPTNTGVVPTDTGCGNPEFC